MKFYITTPIYYVNDAPHIGHAYTSILADVLARFHRLRGEDVFFLTGTDEHGAKVKRSADKINKNVEEFVNENAEKYQKIAKVLNISNDDFIRTTDRKRHWPNVEKMWRRLQEAGDIYKAKYRGLYCVGCEAFVTEKDLEGGKCIYHDKEPEAIEEENYFFKLSKYSDRLIELVEKGEIVIRPESRKNETLAFIKAGLEDVSFSRPAKDLKWGIPVPDDDSQTVYVWCDALANYLFPEKYWPADVHVLAKDIMRFHTIFWPAMLMSAKLSLPKSFLVHGFINVGGKKMSKTVGNVVDPFKLIEEYGADALRYYLLREISPFEDGDFTEEKFKTAYNAGLANGLGNLVSRIMKMAEQFEGFETEKISLDVIGGYMGKMELNKAMDYIWEYISQIDLYIQEEQPFKIIKEDKQKAKGVLQNLVFALNRIAFLLEPFLPSTSEKIKQAIKTNKMPAEPLFPRKE